MWNPFKPKQVLMQSIDLYDVRKAIYDGFRDNAPSTRASMPLYAAVLTQGAARFRYYSELQERITPLIHESRLKTIEIPADTKDFYGDLEKALRKAIRAKS